MAKNTEVKAMEGDVAVLAKQKSTLLYQFYETIKNGGDILSAEDLDIAIESLKLAQKRSTGTLRPCKAESVNFDETQNLYIEGDNLEVLKLLQTAYYNKIKMIYIDPHKQSRYLCYTEDLCISFLSCLCVSFQATAKKRDCLPQ